jgi:N-acetylneuraminic acid mutarotase
MSQARAYFPVVADSHGIIYAIGGGNASCQNLASVEAYDPATNMWTTKAPMPAAVYNQSAALGPDGRIYNFSGQVGGGCTSPSANLFIYDPVGNAWTSGTNVPVAVNGSAAASGAGVNALLYVFGGTTSGPQLPIVQAYDPVANVW